MHCWFMLNNSFAEADHVAVQTGDLHTPWACRGLFSEDKAVRIHMVTGIAQSVHSLSSMHSSLRLFKCKRFLVHVL